MFLPDTNANSISNWVFACSENQYDEIKVPIVVFVVGYHFSWVRQDSRRLIEAQRKLWKIACNNMEVIKQVVKSAR